MGKVAKKVVGETGVLFSFINGEALTCNLHDLPEAIVHKLALHGLSQKVGDSYAGAESVSEALGMARSTWNNLASNQWATKSQRGGKIVEAMVRGLGKSYSECLEVWVGMEKEKKAALKKHPTIMKAMAEIDLEKAQAGMTADPTGGESLSGLFDNLPESLKQQAT